MASFASEAAEPDAAAEAPAEAPATAPAEAPAAAPVILPRKLAEPASARFEEVLPFESFALLDEGGEKVKIYLGLRRALMLEPDAVTATFREQALEIVARVGPHRVRRCHESVLFAHVVPASCKVRVKEHRLIVLLAKKDPRIHWTELGANRKAICGPVLIPNFGEPTELVTGGTGGYKEED